MLKKITRTYREYPSKFWLVAGVSFIDIVGGTILYPFFTLYITWKFNVGMLEAGAVLGIFSIFRIAGNMIGGALTDKFGRRSIIIFGLIFSAVSTLSLGLVNQFSMLYLMVALIGILANIAGPAHQAMVADILPPEQRADGYGVLRVVMNLAWIVGPTIGGIVANRSYFALFVIDSIFSVTVAVLFYFLISETKPESTPDQKAENILTTFKGYGQVLRNLSFVAFIMITIVMTLAYIQLYNSFSVFIRDVHGIQPRGYGVLMSTSAVTVILFQFWTTRQTRNRKPFLMMAVGALFYAAGIGMIGFDPFADFQFTLPLTISSSGIEGTFLWLMLAAVVITVGEMVVMPVSQALAAGFASEDTRGRYLAVFGLGMEVPAAVGPMLAGLILDSPTLNPNLLWYLGALLCLLAAGGFTLLQSQLGNQERFSPALITEKPSAPAPEPAASS